jgi:membrane protein YdbS with pleckstrin-like domain
MLLTVPLTVVDQEGSGKSHLKILWTLDWLDALMVWILVAMQELHTVMLGKQDLQILFPAIIVVCYLEIVELILQPHYLVG